MREYDFTDNPGTTFESALHLIYEDSLTEYIKLLYVNLNTMNIQIPWIYIINNKQLIKNGNEKYTESSNDHILQE